MEKLFITLVTTVLLLSGCTFVLPDSNQPELQGYSYSTTVSTEPIIVKATLVDEYKPPEETLYIKDAIVSATNDSVTIDCKTTAVAKIDVVVMKGEETWFTVVGNRWEYDHHIVISYLPQGKDYSLIVKAFSKDQVDRTVLSASTGITSGELSIRSQEDCDMSQFSPIEFPYQNRPMK